MSIKYFHDVQAFYEEITKKLHTVITNAMNDRTFLEMAFQLFVN